MRTESFGEEFVMRFSARLVFFGVLAVLCAGTVPAAAQAPKVWRHGIISPKSDAGFVLMPSRHGFGDKFGLKIETVSLKDGNLAVKALLAGEVDSIETGAGESIVAGVRGGDVKILGCHWPGLPHAIFAKADITSVQGLKGKTIAASAPGSLPDLLVRGMLDKSGIAVADVHISSVGGDLDRYKALVGGIVEAAVVSSEYLPLAPPSVKLLVAGREVLPNFMRLCVVTTGKTIAERPDEAAKFAAAEISGLRYAVARRDETIKLTREVTSAKADDPRPEFVFDQTVKNHDLDPDMHLPMDKLAWMQDLFVKTGNIKQPIDLKKIVDEGVRQKALALIK
jgi:NitT/TauT family transport system substrate-binding protein